MKKKILLLFSLLLFPISVCAYSNKIIPGGNTIGIHVSSKGILVVGFYKVDGKYNKGTPELKIGDYIIKINNKDVSTSDEFINLLEESKKADSIEVSFLRNKKEYKTQLNLIKIDGSLKTGLYIKDSITGIGTLSYIDPETNVYGALGHEIIESTSKSMINIENGEIFKNSITSIDRSENGTPGSKNAKFYKNIEYGNILKNTKYGIYGIPNNLISSVESLEVKKISEINKGKAYIRTVTKGEKVENYEIEITDINKNSKLKSITFKVTDPDLINKAGGIVQGMSGSPIIQDGYLIGVVTHVLVDDVKKGYAISIITMLDEGDKLLKKIND